MKAGFLQFKLNEKYIPYISWFVVAVTLSMRIVHFPLSSAPFGDEGYYTMEVNYLSKYGTYLSLAQGNSFVNTILIYCFSKIFSLNFLIGSRVLSWIFFLVDGVLFLKCFERFKGIGVRERYFGLIFFAGISSAWIGKGLPDLICFSLLLCCFYVLSLKTGYKQLLFSAVLVFLAFAVKPIAILAIPGVLVFVFFTNIKTAGVVSNSVKATIFIAGFSACFIVYEIPGYQLNHRLMLEDKNHFYHGAVQVPSSNSWPERCTYFAAYNPNHRATEWQVTWEEVDSFKAQHPDINLKLGYVQYARAYFSTWISEIGNKIFLSLPAFTQDGFFFSRWTLINRFIKSYLVIRILTLLLISSIYFFERRFIKDNLLLFAIPFLFAVCISVYIITPLQNNWLMYSLPFLALPVFRFLSRYVNTVILFSLQFIYMLVYAL